MLVSTRQNTILKDLTILSKIWNYHHILNMLKILLPPHIENAENIAAFK